MEQVMALTDILPAVRQLPTLDKLRLIRILAQELETTENIFPFEPYKIYASSKTSLGRGGPYGAVDIASGFSHVIDIHS